jgi:23S rRNA (guanosine2251-2'-O)-methyltransferase
LKEELLYGINPVLEALRSNRRAFELYVAGSITDKRLEKILKIASEKGIPVHTREKIDIARMCASEYHQGVALKVEPFAYANLEDILQICRDAAEPGILLILDGVQDPHNLGALIRSAACAGAHGVIIPKDRAAGITAVVEKASAGAVETIAVAQVVNIVHTLEELKKQGFWIYGAADAAKASIYEQDFTGHTAVVIGSEGEGIRPLVRKKCDVVFSIPIQGGVSSLNASVAGGGILFEMVRQRCLKIRG